MAKTTKKSSPSGPIEPVGEITAGVDTHRDFHVAAALDGLGRLLGTARFDATVAGYAALLGWLAGFGPIGKVGVEGTGGYGAGLSLCLADARVGVVEVNRPNRQKRRRQGKSDPLDAINAARAVLSGEATATPKLRRGPIEAVRVLRQVHHQQVKARTAAVNTLHALLVTAPAELRESLHGLSQPQLVAACAALPAPEAPDPRLRGQARHAARDELAATLTDSASAVRLALAQLATSIGEHTARITALATQLTAVVARIAPATTAQFGLGADTAGQLLVTLGDHPDRIASEAAFAALAGVAPLDASSGQQQHHRLSRAGDRQANSALYRIALCRLAHCDRTRDYMSHRLTANGGNKKDLIRKLKRYIAREIYPHLTADLAALTT